MYLQIALNITYRYNLATLWYREGGNIGRACLNQMAIFSPWICALRLTLSCLLEKGFPFKRLQLGAGKGKLSTHLCVCFLGEQAGDAACIPHAFPSTDRMECLPWAGPGEEVLSISRCIFRFRGRCLLLCPISSEKSDYSSVNSSILFLNILFLLLPVSKTVLSILWSHHCSTLLIYNWI